MKAEFWKWPEVEGKATGIDFSNASVITAGVDIGAISSKAAILSDGKLAAYSILANVADSQASGERALEKALAAAGIDKNTLQKIVSTGYGRANAPYADDTATEVACHARGAFNMYGPTVRTVLDIGGQDTKAIMVDQYGNAISFLMNDKCACGTGRGIETFAGIMAIPIEDIGKLSLEVDEDPEPVSSTCVTYANSMAAQMMRRASQDKVLASYCFAIAWKDYILLQRMANQSGNGKIAEDLAITGGVAKNTGIVSRIERELGIKALTSENADPQIAGAVGAALLAAGMVASGVS
jgi:predicted CoA-substrate-specific enzyme activase